MEVNFNNLRSQAVYAYDRLCEKLNRAINTECAGDWIDGYGTCQQRGVIVIDPNDIQKDMDSLRSMIGAIAMVYEPEDEKFKDVYSEIFPEDKPERMKEFNPESED